MPPESLMFRAESEILRVESERLEICSLNANHLKGFFARGHVTDGDQVNMEQHRAKAEFGNLRRARLGHGRLHALDKTGFCSPDNI